MKNKDCRFCHLSKDEEIIFETDSFVFITSKGPAIRSHFLLLSKEHYSKEPEIPPLLWEDYRKACAKAYKHLNGVTGVEPLTFVNPPQMQSVSHFHRHYLAGVFGVHGVAKALQNYLKQIDPNNDQLP